MFLLSLDVGLQDSNSRAVDVSGQKRHSYIFGLRQVLQLLNKPITFSLIDQSVSREDKEL